MKIKLEVLSHQRFDDDMKIMGLNDDNVENTNTAFISIIGTKECLKYWLDEEDTRHYFKDHPNVLNLEFDDIGEDVMNNGHHFKTIRMEQAEKTIDFIESMINNGVEAFKLHCRAGFSRSRGVGEFIYRYCKEHGIDVVYDDRNEFASFVNQDVLNKLNHAYWKKHKLYEYSGDDKEHPHEFVNIPIKIINREK